MKPIGLLCLLCTILWSFSAYAVVPQTISLQELVTLIEQQYSRTQDFQADFTQETIIEGFDTPLRSSGHFYLKKPGYLRWDYVEPAREHIYVHDDQVKMYVPEHQQVIKGSLTHMVATQAPLRLLQGVDTLTKHFDVQPTGNDDRGESGLPLLTLVPKDQNQQASSPVRKIILEIQPGTYFIQTLSLHEATGNVSTFHFSHFQANQGLAIDIFQFVAPEDAVVIEDLLPQ